jgi:hypothetical protein
MYKKAASIAFALATAFFTDAQTTYLPIGNEDYHLLDRLETRSGQLSNGLFLSLKPVSRKELVRFLQLLPEGKYTSVDDYNKVHAISVSGEWAEDGNGAINSKYPWFKSLYKKQPDLVYVNTDDFFMSANPVLTAQGISENGNFLFTSNRGAEVRARVANKVGVYTFFTDNQETVPSFVADWVDSNNAVPGVDYFKKKGTNNYDYLLARGYIDFAAVKNHVNVTFGYDKHFIGDGMRSLFLSDFSSPATFLRINTRIWKLNYQNLYMELTPQFARGGVGKDPLLPHKYATMHHLSINATRWLNVGLFESVIFDRRNRYEFSYLIPVILYRQIERGLGSPDNVLLGFNFKAIALKHLQFYGQFLLDEFTFSELTAGNGYWANKFGVQIGGKYFDAFTIKNLDLQGEINFVRPYTYTHYDSTANYTHYNQPLAHPLGAGFAEVQGKIQYQPVKNLYLQVKGMYYRKGIDTGSTNYGGNIFKDYEFRSSDYGIGLINGVKVHCALLNLNASYELREHLFIDIGGTHRRYAYMSGLYPTKRSTYFYAGVRLNFNRRDYDFQ